MIWTTKWRLNTTQTSVSHLFAIVLINKYGMEIQKVSDLIYYLTVLQIFVDQVFHPFISE